MQDKSFNVSTQELWARLFKSPTLDGYLWENNTYCELPPFSDYITELCKVKGEKPERVIKRGNIESSYGHRLFSGSRNPSRDTVLQLAFGFELNVEETQQLLKTAHAALLHPRVKRDAVIAFHLLHHRSITDVQLTLHDNDLPLIGGTRGGA